MSKSDLIQNAIHLIAETRSGSCPVLVVYPGKRRSWANKKGVSGLPAGSDPKRFIPGFQLSGLIIEPRIYVPEDHIEYILSRFRRYENGEVIMIMDYAHKERVRRVLRRHREDYPEYADGGWEVEAALSKPFPFTEFKLKVPAFGSMENS